MTSINEENKTRVLDIADNGVELVNLTMLCSFSTSDRDKIDMLSCVFGISCNSIVRVAVRYLYDSFLDKTSLKPKD